MNKCVVRKKAILLIFELLVSDTLQATFCSKDTLYLVVVELEYVLPLFVVALRVKLLLALYARDPLPLSHVETLVAVEVGGEVAGPTDVASHRTEFKYNFGIS